MEPPARRLTLGRARRIRRSGEFARLKSSGKRLAVGCLVLNWSLDPPPPASRLGVISARSVGGAVERNRARRLLREAWRLHQGSFARPAHMILIARPSLRQCTFAQVQADLHHALRRSGLLAPAASPR